MKPRKLVIGDIHGAHKALVQVMERVGLRTNDHLIFLGDYVDGWSESKEVIDLLVTLGETYKCTFIRGNHDTWFEEWLSGTGKNETWTKHGGESTISSYTFAGAAEKQQHIAFLNSMQHYWVDGDNKLYIHAGFSSMHGPEREMYTSNYSWDRTLWEMALTMDRRIKKDSPSYPKRLKLFNEIFIGHTPTLEHGTDKPMNRINVWNIDTGAGFSGKLTVMDTETKEFWQSDVVQTLYPNEKGRN
jgi:serine/threonine protein phosphatase 1